MAEPQQTLPPEAVIAFNAANAAWREGRDDEALAEVGKAIDAAQDLVIAHVLRARILRRAGRDEDARLAYDTALGHQPEQFDALLERGNVLRALGRIDAAAADYLAAMAARTGDSRPALALARLEEERGDAAACERGSIAFQKALDRAAAGPEAGSRIAGLCHDLARFRLGRGDLPRALDALREAELALPSDASAEVAAAIGIDRAEVLLRLGMMDEGQRQMQALSAATVPGVLLPLARLAYRFNFWEEAIAILRRNAELLPQDGQAWLELTEMQIEAWVLDDALTSLDRAEALGGMPEGFGDNLRARIAGRMGDTATALMLYDRLEVASPGVYRASIAMSLLYADHLSPEEVAERHRALFADWGLDARTRESFEADPDPERPLRVGMVTADLHHQHPVNIFLQPLLARWDHDRLPLTVYFTGTTVDDQTRLARSRARGWCDITVDGLPAAVEADGIDILIDLAGHTAKSALKQFGTRLAPVQVSFLGYPGSTGAPNVDWLIGDPVVTPPERDTLCSERVMRLPETVFCYAPETDYPLPDFTAMRGRPLTFGSFNNIPKLGPRTIGLWARVLVALPDSRLLLRAPSFKSDSAIRRFRALFEAEGIAPERLTFRGPVGLDEMMRAYGEVDVALDPISYNGGTTTLQALWMGVPVLTLAGGHFVSRMGASFLPGAGLEDWVAQSEEDFVARAVALTADRDGLVALKAGLRDSLRMRPAWDPDRYGSDFAAALRRIWRETMPPDNDAVGG